MILWVNSFIFWINFSIIIIFKLESIYVLPKKSMFGDQLIEFNNNDAKSEVNADD